MRFNVHGFDQKVAIEFGLSNDELLILRHFEDFVCSGKMESFYEDGYMFYWVNYNKFLEDLPILNINKERLGSVMLYELGTKPLDFNEKIKNYSETTRKAALKRKYTGILKNKTLRNSEVGVRSYFSFSEIFYKLKLEITNCDQAVTHPIKISEPIQYKNGNKDYSINDYSINDINIYSPTDQEEKKNKDIHKRIIDYLNEKAEKSFKSITKKTRDLINARLKEGFVEEDFYKVIDNKVNTWIENAKMSVYLRPETLFGNKFESLLK
ncbi:conserved phage C-terminal domain-containing protein [Clostridioides sp. ES-S-0001-03]|uniref:conserved phage C-terminal domain-containing protein n=1 Tax=Clostridioides sp. ES-S-0001-03 TaxID=2770771 RepID=UPI001D0C545F|nr:conserved phage C-terminal domain-containing protein [Clostridioides sp. ES-S-0001-03]